MARKKHTSRKIKVHTFSYIIIVAILIMAGIGSLIIVNEKWHADQNQARYQQSIQAFYQPPSPLPSTTPGHVIRSEKMNLAVPRGGTAYRMLYITQTPDNTPAVSSGMVFVPAGAAPAEGRKVIAWAHGTQGFGDNCTPSRSLTQPLHDMENWLDGAMQRGYVVTATDYVGIGTPGEPYYLIGKSEAYDVINSVRAAHNMPEVRAGTTFIPWGHSQGGHSALFAAIEAPHYAPELTLAGVAAAAPAAELDPLFAQQYNKTVAWAIGPDAATSWPRAYPDLKIKGILSQHGEQNYQKLAYGCVAQQGVGLTLRNLFDDQFFATNPLNNPSWAHATKAETPDTTILTVPIYVAQGLNDQVVLPNTTALLAQKACDGGRVLQMNWLGSTDHGPVAVEAGPSVVAWMQDRFAGLAPPSSCGQPLPLPPAIPTP